VKFDPARDKLFGASHGELKMNTKMLERKIAELQFIIVGAGLGEAMSTVSAELNRLILESQREELIAASQKAETCGFKGNVNWLTEMIDELDVAIARLAVETTFDNQAAFADQAMIS